MGFFGKKKDSSTDDKKEKKVVAFGTFDVLHPGHEFYLRAAKKMGDYLTVVVARDKTVEEIKGCAPEQSEEERIEGLKKYKTANEIILGCIGDRYEVLKRCQPDVLALGYDQEVDEKELQEKLKEMGFEKCKIKRMKSFKPEIYKSSKMKDA